MYLDTLQKLGLSDNEAKIYEFLLEKGPKPAQEVVQTTGLGRGNAYNYLALLIKKGLVIESQQAKKTYYQAADPEKLRNLAKEQLLKSEETLNTVNAALPALKSFYRLTEKQPGFRVFEGLEGIKEMYLEILNQGQEIYGISGTDEPDPELYSWLRKKYAVERVKLGIQVHGVMSASHRADELLADANKELRDVVALDPLKFPLRGEIHVFGDSVAFIDHRTENMIGIMLESSSLAQSLRSIIQATISLQRLQL